MRELGYGGHRSVDVAQVEDQIKDAVVPVFWVSPVRSAQLLRECGERSVMPAYDNQRTKVALIRHQFGGKARRVVILPGMSEGDGAEFVMRPRLKQQFLPLIRAP